MKRISTLIFVSIFAISTTCLEANTAFYDRDSDKNEYSWRPTDESQSRQALGMVIWGFTMVVFTLAISAIIPNDPAPPTATGKGGGNAAPGS